ncbi:Cap15 family cyclic dinucleotide receptor domain-containing protein [Marinibaculum pumilum]
MIVPYAVWRWVSGVQRWIFPYLGGQWSGSLEFQGPRGTGKREVTLTVRHSLLHIVLILDSAESTSRTLVVHADRDAGINRDRLYYVYLNERKEGTPGAGDSYRGLAVLRVEWSGCLALVGDYFTERQGGGTLLLQRSQSHPWWALWK